MKRITLITCLIFLSLTGNAQQKLIGIKGALALTNIEWGKGLPNTKFMPNFATGFSFDYLFKNKVRLGSELLLERRGFKDKLNYTDGNGVTIGELKYSIAFTYISIPIKVGYTIGNRIYGFGNAGLIPAFLLSSKYNTDDIHFIGNNKNLTSTNPKFDLATLAEIGIGCKTKNNINVYTAFRFQNSLTSTLKEPFANGRSPKHVGLSLCAGLSYQL